MFWNKAFKHSVYHNHTILKFSRKISSYDHVLYSGVRDSVCLAYLQEKEIVISVLLNKELVVQTEYFGCGLTCLSRCRVLQSHL